MKTSLWSCQDTRVHVSQLAGHLRLTPDNDLATLIADEDADDDDKYTYAFDPPPSSPPHIENNSPYTDTLNNGRDTDLLPPSNTGSDPESSTNNVDDGDSSQVNGPDTSGRG